MKLIAHRGYRAKFPENSLLSFEKALEYGADGIEFDVRMSEDGELIIIHDPYIIDRSNSDALIIAETRLERLKKIDLGMNQHISVLREIIEKLDRNTFLDIEFKVPEVVKPSVKLLKDLGFKNLMFSSFVRDCLRDLKKEFPEAIIGLLYEVYELKEVKNLFKFFVEEIRHFKSDSLNLPIEFFRGRNNLIESLRELRKSGIKIAFWTVNEKEDLEYIRSVTDFLITDEVEKMRKLV